MLLMGSNNSRNGMNQALDIGPCFAEDIKKIEEQNNSCGSIESSDTSHGIHKNDGIAGINENPEEDESTISYQRKKRLKKNELCDLPKIDSENIEEAASSFSGPPHIVENTCLDQPVESASAEDGISVEVTEIKLAEEDLDDGLGFLKTCSNNDGKVLFCKSNGNKSESCDADKLALKVMEPRTENSNNELPRVASDDACCKGFPVNSDNKGCYSPASNNAIMTSTSSLMEEQPNEAEETGSDDKVHVEFEEENVDNFQRVSSCALSGDTSVTSDAGLLLEQSDGLIGVASQAVKESVNVARNRDPAGYTGKKLLVLDVNGLLVDISPYVPYDYDPDEIILRKAVFKRPYCDDFLKFCFERFNVGVWSSRTKRNMEPILDFLLGNDKSKLLFCWDQSYCTNTGFTTVEKRYKPLLLKKLKKLWDKCEPDLPWEKGFYNESNTLLLDDTPYKALYNPRYTAIFPNSYRFRNVRDNSLGPGGDLRVYLEGLAMAENVQEYVKQNPFGQRAITEKNLSWGFYCKVIEASTTPPRQTEEDDS